MADPRLVERQPTIGIRQAYQGEVLVAWPVTNDIDRVIVYAGFTGQLRRWCPWIQMWLESEPGLQEPTIQSSYPGR